MAAMLADIDATCASLGYYDGTNYIPEKDSLQCLKHLIWILRRDGDTHEYRRHLGCGKVLQTDLLPMLMHQNEENEMSDVLLRLLVNLTTPTLLIYNEELPKDGPNRKNYLQLVEILQGYKSAFSLQPVWAALEKRFQKVLNIDWAERTEEQGLLIERILVLIRNVLQVPASPEMERRADNDASLHDQVIWSLHQSGILDIVLYIIGSEYENQYHLHALEIICLLYREQTAASLAEASLQRSAAEKYRDEQELVAARRREQAKHNARPPSGRHSRFGGTFVIQNVRSISDKDIIAHQPIHRVFAMEFDRDKNKQKRSHRVVKEQATIERRSAFSIRLFLREFAIEILRSAYNTLLRQVRRVLERNSSGHDDSYLLWAIRFFMEFNRLIGFQLPLVSESLSISNFHWVLNRVQHHLDMLTSDKKNVILWGKRLHIAIQALKELYLSLVTLQTIPGEETKAVYKVLLNNVCYVLEFRETTLHAVVNYNEAYNTKVYLRDVVEMVHIFFKMMEKFCNGRVVVQNKRRTQKKSKTKKTKQATKIMTDEEKNESLQNNWANFAPQISAILTDGITLPEEEHPLPFDAVSEKPLEQQKDDCMITIYNMLHKEKFEHAVVLLRSARDVWPEDNCFGAYTAAPEDELMLLRNVFFSNLGPVAECGSDRESLIDSSNERSDDDDSNDEEEGHDNVEEVDFHFEDFAKRLVNPKVVRACTVVLSDWEIISARTLKSAVTLLHRIAFGCKMPAILYQASLFRIFQHVFDAPKNAHHEELRRLGVYIIRQFVQIAPSNPKIYAELLFYKSIREANDIENGYDTIHMDKNKKAWTEEQEDELRQLYMENQANPSTEQDVIDWMLDNMIEKNRTRRAVIKKLKELGLIFKAPTRKSVASHLAKSAWYHDQDNRLRELYDQHRLQDDCLTYIMEEFIEARSRNAVIKRMIQLGLIADRSEILPSKRKKQSKSAAGDFENDSEDDDVGSNSSDESGSETDTRRVKVTVKHVKNRKTPNVPKVAKGSEKTITKNPLNYGEVQKLIDGLKEKEEDSLAWIQESLMDAAVDAEDVSEDPDDGVPLVPFTAAQREAFENPKFLELLKALGFQEPLQGMETYWRIPVTMTAAEMKERSQLVSGEHFTQSTLTQIDEEENFDRLVVSDSEDETISEITISSQNRQNNVNAIVYNKSDDEDEPRLSSPIKASKTANKKKSKSKFDIFNMLKTSEDNNDTTNDETQEFEIDSEDIRDRLAQLEQSDESDNEMANPTVTKHSDSRTRKRITIADSDSDEDKRPETNTLEETNASDDENDVDKENIGMGSQTNKRDRSDSDESLPGEDILRKKKKVTRVVAALSDDDDE